jgi:hypothetical protein
VTRVLILSAVSDGKARLLQEHIDAFRAADPHLKALDVVTLCPSGPWRDGDPTPIVLGPPPAIGGLRGKVRANRILRLATFTGDRSRMTRLAKRNTAVGALARAADVVYADLPAALPSGWWTTRINPTVFATTSPVEAHDAIAEHAAR